MQISITARHCELDPEKASQQPDAVTFTSDLVNRLLLGGIVPAILSLGLGLLFALRVTAPVRRVQGTARAIAAGDRSVPISLERSDELGDVGRALASFSARALALDHGGLYRGRGLPGTAGVRYFFPSPEKGSACGVVQRSPSKAGAKISQAVR